MKKILIFAFLLLSMSAKSQIKRDTVLQTYKMYMESKKPKEQVPFKRDSVTILYNPFRDYVEWIQEQEKKKQK